MAQLTKRDTDLFLAYLKEAIEFTARSGDPTGVWVSPAVEVGRPGVGGWGALAWCENDPNGAVLWASAGVQIEVRANGGFAVLKGGGLIPDYCDFFQKVSALWRGAFVGRFTNPPVPDATLTTKAEILESLKRAARSRDTREEIRRAILAPVGAPKAPVSASTTGLGHQLDAYREGWEIPSVGVDFAEASNPVAEQPELWWQRIDSAAKEQRARIIGLRQSIRDMRDLWE